MLDTQVPAAAGEPPGVAAAYPVSAPCAHPSPVCTSHAHLHATFPTGTDVSATVLLDLGAI